MTPTSQVTSGEESPWARGVTLMPPPYVKPTAHLPEMLRLFFFSP